MVERHGERRPAGSRFTGIDTVAVGIGGISLCHEEGDDLVRVGIDKIQHRSAGDVKGRRRGARQCPGESGEHGAVAAQVGGVEVVREGSAGGGKSMVDARRVGPGRARFRPILAIDQTIDVELVVGDACGHGQVQPQAGDRLGDPAEVKAEQGDAHPVGIVDLDAGGCAEIRRTSVAPHEGVGDWRKAHGISKNRRLTNEKSPGSHQAKNTGLHVRIRLDSLYATVKTIISDWAPNFTEPFDLSNGEVALRHSRCVHKSKVKKRCPKLPLVVPKQRR